MADEGRELFEADFDEEPSGTVFRDVILLALIGFAAMLIIVLPHVHEAAKRADGTTAPGNVIVEIHWPSDIPLDVDLWVEAPGDVPVGFWNQGSRYFNLLRDDLGGEGDATRLNYEVSYSRGIPTGEYTVNVHMYGPLPPGDRIPVQAVVSVRPPGERARQILSTTIELTYRNQEETAFRFRLGPGGELRRESVTTLRRRLATSGRVPAG